MAYELDGDDGGDLSNSAGKGDENDTDAKALNASPRRRKRKTMDKAIFQGAFRLAYQDSEEYIDGHVAGLRAVATKYYQGEPFGNEETGRSQIVMTELRDVVQGIMPSLLRIFTQSESVVEFLPQSAETIPQADQQTALCNYVFYHDNPGFLNLYSVFKDALVRKTGVLKLRWSDDRIVTETAFQGLLLEQVQILKDDDTVEILELTEEGTADMSHPGDPNPPPPVPTYDVRIRRDIPEKCLIVEALPPEEYLINRDATNPHTRRGYNFQAHRSYKTVSDIVAMGYSQDEVEENMGGGDTFNLNYEAQTRNPAVLAFMGGQDTPDPAMREVLFIEAYMRVDKDMDGFAELRKIHAIGDAAHILSDEMVEDAPFAVFCPDPEPHMVIGQSVADQTMDLQLIKSNMVRALLDSLAGSIHPRTVIVEGQVNMDDAMNTEQGAIIRARQIAAVQELVKPFIGQQAIPVIAYMDQVKAKRTGVSDASQGLDPDVLQSTAQNAVNATVQGAQERIEMYARIFAEGPMKHVFKLAAKLLRENQDVERVIKLNGEWVPVSPATWEMELECVPNVALGKGTDTEKMGVLQGIIAKQELIMQTLGPANPLANLKHYRAAIVKYVGLTGAKDASVYFGPVDDDYLAKLQHAAENPAPSPQMAAVQVEGKNYDQKHQLAVAEFQAKTVAEAREAARKAEKDKWDVILKMTDLQGKYGDQDPMMDQLKLALEHSTNMAEQANTHARGMEDLQLNHQREMARLAADQHSNMVGHAVAHAGNESKAHVDHQLGLEGVSSRERTAIAAAAMKAKSAVEVAKAKPKPKATSGK
jgi:hypothetical protein